MLNFFYGTAIKMDAKMPKKTKKVFFDKKRLKVLGIGNEMLGEAGLIVNVLSRTKIQDIVRLQYFSFAGRSSQVRESGSQII